MLRAAGHERLEKDAHSHTNAIVCKFERREIGVVIAIFVKQLVLYPVGHDEIEAWPVEKLVVKAIAI
jgi:hypothetical protein